MLDRLRDLWTERPAVVAAAVIAPIAFVITLLVLFLAVGRDASGDLGPDAAAARIVQADQEQDSSANPPPVAVVVVDTQSDDQRNSGQTQQADSADQQSTASNEESAQQESTAQAHQDQGTEQQQSQPGQQQVEEDAGPLVVAGFVVVPLDSVLEEELDEDALQHGSDGSEGGILPISNGVVVSSREEDRTTWELLVPSAGLKSTIVRVGRTESGAMGSPDNPYVIGWLDSSAAPGETGNALLAGHRDFEDKSGNIGTGVCWELVNTEAGDLMLVRDHDSDIYYVYTVTEAVTINPYDPDAVRYLRNTEEAVITLITCTGAFNAETHQYSHRFVVVGVLAAVASPDA